MPAAAAEIPLLVRRTQGRQTPGRKLAPNYPNPPGGASRRTRESARRDHSSRKPGTVSTCRTLVDHAGDAAPRNGCGKEPGIGKPAVVRQARERQAEWPEIRSSPNHSTTPAIESRNGEGNPGSGFQVFPDIAAVNRPARRSGLEQNPAPLVVDLPSCLS